MKKMKTKLTGVVAIAMALTIAFSGVALASPAVQVPLCPKRRKPRSLTSLPISNAMARW
jgi:hypothetical protein